MTRKFFSALLILALFGSCHKSELAKMDETPATFTSFRDKHIALVEFKMEQTASRQVALTFTTRYEKEIKSIEVFSGESTSTLCSMHEQKVSGDSHALKTYQVVHPSAGADVNFYMVKYTALDGNWAYSPVYQLKMK